MNHSPQFDRHAARRRVISRKLWWNAGYRCVGNVSNGLTKSFHRPARRPVAACNRSEKRNRRLGHCYRDMKHKANMLACARNAGGVRPHRAPCHPCLRAGRDADRATAGNRDRAVCGHCAERQRDRAQKRVIAPEAFKRSWTARKSSPSACALQPRLPARRGGTSRAPPLQHPRRSPRRPKPAPVVPAPVRRTRRDDTAARSRDRTGAGSVADTAATTTDQTTTTTSEQRRRRSGRGSLWPG